MLVESTSAAGTPSAAAAAAVSGAKAGAPAVRSASSSAAAAAAADSAAGSQQAPFVPSAPSMPGGTAAPSLPGSSSSSTPAQTATLGEKTSSKADLLPHAESEDTVAELRGIPLQQQQQQQQQRRPQKMPPQRAAGEGGSVPGGALIEHAEQDHHVVRPAIDSCATSVDNSGNSASSANSAMGIATILEEEVDPVPDGDFAYSPGLAHTRSGSRDRMSLSRSMSLSLQTGLPQLAANSFESSITLNEGPYLSASLLPSPMHSTLNYNYASLKQHNSLTLLNNNNNHNNNDNHLIVPPLSPPLQPFDRTLTHTFSSSKTGTEPLEGQETFDSGKSDSTQPLQYPTANSQVL